MIRKLLMACAIGAVLGGAADHQAASYGEAIVDAGAQAFLFRMASNDVQVFAAAVAVLAASGLVACVLPARRAARVDPLIALRGNP